MQELASSDASESTLIASRGQEGFSLQHPTAKLQQRDDKMIQPLWEAEEQIRSFHAASGWQHTGSRVGEVSGQCKAYSLRWLAQPVCPSYTMEHPARKAESCGRAFPVMALLRPHGPESLWW